MESRLKYKLSQLSNAIENFEASLNINLGLFPEIVSDSIESGQIQKFEFSCELLWKVIKLYLLEIERLDVATPKNVYKTFLEAGYCNYEEYEQAIKMLDDRNSLSHLYKKELVKKILLLLPDYLQIMKKFLARLNLE